MNLAAITSFLQERLRDELTAAFIYGSVAAGRAGPDSDVDCFVITNGELAEQRRAQLATDFTGLQRSLGFTPDPDYPIELFSGATCEAVLAGEALDRILATATVTGRIDADLASSDDVEVLRALLDRRLVLQHGEVLDQLTTQAHALLARHAAQPAPLLRALGLAEEAR